MSDNVQIAMLLSLTSACLWGLGPVLYKQFYMSCSAYFSYILDAIFGSCLVLLPFALMGQPEFRHLHTAMLLTAPYSLAYLLYLRSFELGEVGQVSVVVQSYPVITMLLASAFGTEAVGLFQLGLMLIVVFAAMAIALAGEGFGASANLKQWFVLACMTALLLGTGDFLLDRTVASYNVYTMTLAIFLTQLLISAALLFFFRQKMTDELAMLRLRPALLWRGLSASLAMSFGAIAFYKAFEFGSVVVVSSLASLEPVFALALAYILLGEKLNRVQLSLFVITLTALILLLLWS